MEIKRFGDMQGNTIMLLHGNLMCWRQFEDLIPGSRVGRFTCSVKAVEADGIHPEFLFQ